MVLVFEVYSFAYNPYIAFLLIYRILKMDCKHKARGVSFFVLKPKELTGSSFTEDSVTGSCKVVEVSKASISLDGGNLPRI